MVLSAFFIFMKVSEKYNNYRLDFALEEDKEFANYPKRARKRLCDRGLVLVNGKKRPASYKVRTGNEITVLKEEDTGNLVLDILKEDENYIAFYKERGIPTAKIEGMGSSSLEEAILLQYPSAIVLNRLDNDTSGIVLICKHERAYAKYKEAQDEGRVKKYYLAHVENEVENSFVVDNSIDISRIKVRVLDEEALDHTRRTEVKKLCSQNGTSLVECIIYKGVRHQIRAHMAYIGNALVNDTLYGIDEDCLEDKSFMLHHYKIEWDDFSLVQMPKDHEWQELFSDMHLNIYNDE